MNDEVENTNPCREITLPIDSRNFHNFIYGVYGGNITTDEDRWYNFIHKRRLLTHSVRNLNKCGIEVDYYNRNKIIHNYE